MTETEKLKAVLEHCRRADAEDALDLIGSVFSDAQEAMEMFQYAKDNGYVRGEATFGGFIPIGITPLGRAVLSGSQPSPFEQRPSAYQAITMYGPNYGQVGNHNTQRNSVAVHLKALVQAVVESDLPADQKRSALERLYSLASDGTIGNAAGLASFVMEALSKLGG